MVRIRVQQTSTTQALESSQAKLPCVSRHSIYCICVCGVVPFTRRVCLVPREAPSTFVVYSRGSDISFKTVRGMPILSQSESDVATFDQSFVCRDRIGPEKVPCALESRRVRDRRRGLDGMACLSITGVWSMSQRLVLSGGRCSSSCYRGW